MADARDARIVELEAELARLREENADLARVREENAELRRRLEALEELLRRNSSNSSKPPSSDAPADRDARPRKPPSGRKQGAQKGHKGARRELIPAEKVGRIQDCFPSECRRCRCRLPRRPDADPLRHQVVETPPVAPQVTEYRRHRVRCDCGETTCGSLPAGVPHSMCGPRLMGIIGLLTGVYRVSRRGAAAFLSDVLGVRISVGALSESEERVSESVAVPVEQAREHVCEQPIKHVDATSWRQQGQPRTLWTVATALVTAFSITVDATREGLRTFLKSVRGILVSDRGKQFGFWAMEQRQICWAHLLRKFVSFAERGGAAATLGEDLLFWSTFLLREWHEVRAGPRARGRFRLWIAPVQARIEHLLTRGARMGAPGVSGACRDILAHRAALWTFLSVVGVDPTNNHAERELRAFVLWRKSSFGSQSDRGSRFAERMMTVVHTLRKQNRHVLSYLTAACEAALRGGSAPSLIPTP